MQAETPKKFQGKKLINIFAGLSERSGTSIFDHQADYFRERRTTSFGIDDILGDSFGKRKLFEYEDLSDEGDLAEHIRSDSNDSAIYATSEGPSKNSDKGTNSLKFYSKVPRTNFKNRF